MTAFERRLTDRSDKPERLYTEPYHDRARLNEMEQVMLDA